METGFLLELALILIVTRSLALLMKRFHLPQVLSALATGLVMGPALLGWIQPSEIMSALADIGVILLMFTAGLETDLKKLRSTFSSSLVISLLGVITPLAGGFLAAWAFGFTSMESFFVGLILASTSVSIAVQTLQEMGKISTKTGTTIMGAAVIDDILGILLLSLVTGSHGGAVNVQVLGILLAKVVLFFGLAGALGLLFFKTINFLLNKYGNSRSLPIFSLGFCFFLAFLAEELGMAGIIGAYVAGIALCNAKAEKYIEARTCTLSYMFFTPIFFISVGANASFGGMTKESLYFGIVLVLVAILSKLFGCGLGSRLRGFSNRESAQIAGGMVARGEMSLIVASKGLALGLVAPNLFSSVILMVIATSIVTPLILNLSYNEKKSIIFEKAPYQKTAGSRTIK